jgi:hypothetical protein
VADEKFGAIVSAQLERERVISENDGNTETIRNSHATHVFCRRAERLDWGRDGTGRTGKEGWRQPASGDHSQFAGTSVADNGKSSRPARVAIAEHHLRSETADH